MKRKIILLVHAVMTFMVIASPFLAVNTVHAARAGSPSCPPGRVLFGREQCIGYFSGRDVYGSGGIDIDSVINNGGNSLMGVTNATNFISTLRTLLYGSNYDDSFGSAFIIATMMGRSGSSFGGSRNTGIAWAKSNFATWEARVRYYDSQGRANWNQLINFNAPFQNSGRSRIIISDDIFYMKQSDETQRTIVFTNPNGTKFEIKKNCGNLVGTPTPLVPLPAYELSPDIGVSINNGTKTGDVVQVGDTVRFTYAVENDSSTNSDGSTQCRIYGNAFNGYVPTPPPGSEHLSSSGGYIAPATGCPRVFNRNTTTTLATENITITTANQTICRTLWINPYAAGQAHRANEVCLIVAAQPYVKVFGGDVSAGNGIIAGAGNNCTPNANASITSWNKGSATFAGAGTQFAALALGTIEEFASGQNTTGAVLPSGLTFANSPVDPDSYGGEVGSLPCIPDYYTLKPASTMPVSSNVSNMGTGAYEGSGTVTLDGGNVNPSERMTVYVNGNVYINGNITYTPNWSFRNTPLFQLVVRGDIFIDNNVTQLDGVYIAQANGAVGGNIYTCATGPSVLALNGALYNTCNTKLTVNGLFSAKQIHLMRTSGTISQSTAAESRTSNSAAEVFNYNPSLWIAQPAPGSNTNNTKVGDYDSITSLPPVL